MTSGKLYDADHPLLRIFQRDPKICAQVKAIFPIAVLSFLVLFSASCGQTTEGQPGNPKQVNQVAKSQITYVAIGASDTFGLGTSDPYTQNWATDLAEKLGQRVHLINLGIPGVTVHDALSSELPIALDSHPELVTIWLGVNDIANNVPISSYSQDLDLMLKRLRSHAPSARIMIANIPDLTLLPYFSSSNQQLLHQHIKQYNVTIARISQQYNVLLVDLSRQNFNLQDHPEYISNDGLHPTDIGYFQLAELFYKSLQPPLG